MAFGEGYHNFHHEFPIDYRNGVHWYAIDPLKWTIWFCSQIRLAYDLKRCPGNEIKPGELQEASEIRPRVEDGLLGNTAREPTFYEVNRIRGPSSKRIPSGNH